MSYFRFSPWKPIFSSHIKNLLLRLRVASVKTEGRKIHSVGNFFAKSAAYIFVIMLNLIFTPLIEVQMFSKKNLAFLRWTERSLNGNDCSEL